MDTISILIVASVVVVAILVFSLLERRYGAKRIEFTKDELMNEILGQSSSAGFATKAQAEAVDLYKIYGAIIELRDQLRSHQEAAVERSKELENSFALISHAIEGFRKTISKQRDELDRLLSNMPYGDARSVFATGEEESSPWKV